MLRYVKRGSGPVKRARRLKCFIMVEKEDVRLVMSASDQYWAFECRLANPLVPIVRREHRS